MSDSDAGRPETETDRRCAPDTDSREPGPDQTRGQSAIIGVALLLALTIISVGVLTAGTGMLVDEAARGGDAQRIADRLATAYNPTTLEGTTRLSVALTGGQLSTEEREITLRRSGDIVASLQTSALRFEHGDHHIIVLGQAVIRGQADRATFVREPGLVSLFGAEGDRTLAVSIVDLSGSVNETILSHRTVGLQLHGAHERRNPGPGLYTLSIETTTPDLWKQYLAEIATKLRVVGNEGAKTQRVIADLGRISRARLILHEIEMSIND